MAGEKDEKIPEPKDIEKEIGDFLSEKFGGRVKLISPVVLPEESSFEDDEEKKPEKKRTIDFSLKPEELEAYLDQFIVKQDQAKAILATKICTHFNRIKYAESSEAGEEDTVGQIKNNEDYLFLLQVYHSKSEQLLQIQKQFIMLLINFLMIQM